MFCGILGLVAWGCSAIPTGQAESPTPAFVTATLPPTSVPSLTPIPPSSTPEPTATPRAGITSTQLYVRAGPDAASKELGLLATASAVQILGQDPTGSWYEIAYARGDEGIGWIAAQYVQVADKDTLPVIEMTAQQGPRGTVTQQENVREGPGTEFDSLGTLAPGTAILATGKDSSGSWLQIQYPADSDKEGWVAAQYVEASGLDALPILDKSGQAAGTATPAAPQAEPTPTLAAAPADGDSLASPAVDVVFSPTGSGSLIYTDEVSTPDGDATDWIGFAPYLSGVVMRLTCSGDGQLTAKLLRQGEAVQNWDGLACGQTKQQSLDAGEAYVLGIGLETREGAPAYVRYVLTIQASR